MAEPVTFFHIKDPKRHAMTQSGYKVLESAGRLIVYCTDEGPLDRQNLPQWIDLRKEQPEKVC